MFRTFHSKTAEYTFFFLSAHGQFSRIDNIMGQNKSLSKFKIIEFLSSNFLITTLRLDVNYGKKGKTQGTQSYGFGKNQVSK